MNATLHSDKVSALLAELTHYLGREVHPIPMAEFRDEILETYRSKHRNTRNRMAQAFRELLALAETSNHTAMTSDLSPGLIERFSERPGRCSTTNGLLASLRAAFRIGADKGRIHPAEVSRIVWRKTDDDEPRGKHHSREDICRVLELLRSRSKKNWSAGRLHALAAVYAFTGLRRNEALRLRVEDVDLVQGVIFVRPNGGRLKTKKSRAPVPCPAALGKILCNWLSRCGSEWVFPCVRKRDRPWMHGKAGCRPGDRLKAAGKEAGVEGFTPQSLRHSLATHLAGWWGLKEKQIQLILRHTTVKTQRHYVHPDVVNLCKSVRDFDYAEGAKDPRSLPKFRMRPGVKMRSRIGSRPLAVRPML